MFPPRFAPILQEMEPLAALFREAGHRLFLVGGSVRDLFLGDTDAGTDLSLIRTRAMPQADGPCSAAK